MQKLLDTLVQAARTHEDLADLQEYLANYIEIESNPQRVAIGLDSYYLEFQEDSIWFVCGGDRIEVKDIIHMRSVVADLEQRLLLPFTGGTDEDFDVEGSEDGTMSDEIIGGSILSGGENGGDVVIDDSQTSTTSTWSSEKINTELQTKASGNHGHALADINDLQATLDAKMSADVIGDTNPASGSAVWFEPGAISPQPWVYKSNNWYSAAFPIDFPAPKFVGSANEFFTMSKLIPPRIPRIFVENVYAQLRSDGSGDNYTNYYSMLVRVWSISPVGGVFSTELLNYNNQGHGLGSSRFTERRPQQVIEYARYIEFRLQRLGSGANISLVTSATIDIRYGR
jgi:hypothetical protein